ncbi:hypothetical protein HNQ93_002517 [Hymenobacter luteus]|uniref:Lipoprotein n=2 Tax=Hymenobacter TaxID=89966 RepID=A0A7W9T128_9BACT|nr:MULTISPECIES: hypothetical protein [Hymenobacter]MBB4601914.1 hypothetical protein [Hymenobacter latericoloratus]MBB6059657.1 hypothetical protein [Hymenobacter luteus]
MPSPVLFYAPRLVAATLITTALAGCLSLDSKPDTCSTEVLAPTTQVLSPATGQVGTPVTVRYTLQIINGCGEFKSLSEQRSGNHIYLSPVVAYQGCVCPEVVSSYEGSYPFTATQPGTYIFHFPSATPTPLTDTLVVQ